MDAEFSIKLTQQEAYLLCFDIEDLLSLAKKAPTYSGHFGSQTWNPPEIWNLLTVLRSLSNA